MSSNEAVGNRKNRAGFLRFHLSELAKQKPHRQIVDRSPSSSVEGTDDDGPCRKRGSVQEGGEVLPCPND